ncbi:MAG: replication restart helicase PriA, partial [Candidatus Saccharimonadales bacterium]
MAYLSVLAASSHYHGTEALTYSYNHHLNKGSLVEISLRNRLVPGIVIGPAKKPEFAVKEIDYVYDLPPLSAASLQLIDWMISFYPAPLGSIANLFLPASLTKKISAYQPEPVKAKSVALPSLTKDQSRVVQTIKDRPDQQTFLLHGDTGTGKTRIYLELAQEVLKDGRDVLVLTPEIGLTPQLVRDFEATFSNQIVVWHSNLTPAQRRNVWLQIITAESPVVVIGPRSALFAPFRQLGLIVVDESHEQAYKQEQQPRYQAIRVASQLAQIYQARLIIGSATPAVAEYYIATVKNIPILRMEELAVRAINQSTDVKIIDSKNKDFFKRNYILSDDLLAGISRALKQKKQSLIFLNRRGTARLVLCQNCGWEQHCPNCDLPLTYHGDKHEMRCHTCGYKAAAPLSCPVCHSNEILYRSVGTKSLVEILAKLFPEARIRRFDTDNTKEEQLAQNYESVANGKVDILAGTQLITKGLDLPKLAMVGIVAADSALSFPDYTADERTYQMLSQVIGRV